MFSGISNTSGRVESSFFLIVGACVVLFCIVIFFMLLFLFKYNKKKMPHPGKVKESFWLEVTWTVIPVILVSAMFYIGWTDFNYIRKPPQKGLLVKVTGRQWSWGFSYENGKKSDVLRVPVGRPVKLTLTSDDVIHSFYIPAYRVKEDVVPGMETHLWFVGNTTGTYDIFCAEYCGVAHSHMLSKLIVMPAGDFDAWYQVKEEAVAESAGQKLLETKACLGCHTTDGTRKVGPTFKGLYGSKQVVVSNGKERTVLVDEAYIRKYILKPNVDIVKGYPPVMPVVPLTQEELDQIVAYLKTL